MATTKAKAATDSFFEVMDAEDFWEGTLVDPGNVFSGVGYFVQVPTWWRRFLFRVISARDLAVYLYVCSYMSTQQSSRPTIQTIAGDLGVTNRHGIGESLQRLVYRGFLLRNKMPVPLPDVNRHPRYIYQRPCVAFTLHRLLSEGLIDAYLHPTRKTMKRGQEKMPGHNVPRLERALVEPLKRIIGDAAFSQYARLRSEVEKRKLLIRRLEIDVETLRLTSKAKRVG